MIALADARRNRLAIDWATQALPKPKFIGKRVFRNYDLREIAEAIDWGPFFQTWELHGAFPGILNDEVVGESARRVYGDGQMMLKKVLSNRWLAANAIVGFYPAASVDEDIVLYADETARDADPDLDRAAPADPEAVRHAEPSARRLHRAEGLGTRRLDRRVRGHPPASASTSSPPASRPSTTTTRRSC